MQPPFCLTLGCYSTKELVLLSDITISITASQRTPLDHLLLMVSGTYPHGPIELYIFVHFKKWGSGFQSAWNEVLRSSALWQWHVLAHSHLLGTTKNRLLGQLQLLRGNQELRHKFHLIHKGTPLRLGEVTVHLMRRNKCRSKQNEETEQCV